MKRIYYLLSLSFCLFHLPQDLWAQTSGQALITYGSSWKYLDNGTNQATAWRAVTFNDGSWKSGNGKFGYGITDATTSISYGSRYNKKYITTYFRKSISIDPALYSSFTANVKRDDGVIVYVNGAEVYRNNLAQGPISYTTLATEAADNGYSPRTFTISASAFISGTNVIAVEIHQARVTTPDMAFDLALTGNTGGDKTPPTVASINRQSPLTQTTNASTLTFRTTFSEKVNNVDYTDFTLSIVSGTVGGTLNSQSVVAVGTNGTTYDVTINSVNGNGTLRLDLKATGTGITDDAGNAITGGFTGGQTYIVNQTQPSLTSVSILSGNTNSSLARVGDVITLSFTAAQPINTPTVTIATHAVTATAGINNSFTATYTMTTSDAETTVPFTINFTDMAGNAGTQVTTTTNGSSVRFDKTAPAAASINRQSPLTQTTNASTLTFRTTFSEKVNNVDYTDFTLSIVSGTVNGTLNSQSVVAVGTNGTTYDVTLNSVNGNGTLRLDLKATGTGITDDAGNAIAGGFTGGQTYIVNQTQPSLTSVSILSGNTNSSLARVGDVITLSFTAAQPINTPTVTIATHAVTATAGINNSFTATYTMTSSDAETTVPFTINFTDMAGNAGTQVITTTNGSSVRFDKTVPAVISINRQLPLTQTTNASTLTFRATFSEKVNNVDYTDFTLSIVSGTVGGTLNSQSVVAVGTNGTTYDVTVNSVNGNGTLRLDLKATGTGISDDAGNAIAGGFTGGQTYIVNQTQPSLTSVSILSGNTNSSLARVGDVITLSFTAAQPINTPTVTIATHAVTATAGINNSFTATYTMTSSDAETTVPFTINFTDMAGNAGTQVTTTTNGSSVRFDKTVPAVISINRQSPLTQTTNASTLTFRTTFSEKVNNVDYTDFILSIVSGTVSGILNNQSVVAVGTNGTTYDVTINSVNGNGTLRLDLKGTGTGITDDAGNAIAGGFTGGQTYIVNQTAPSLTSVSILSSNSNSSLARVGDVITLSFTASEPINTPTVTIATHAVTATAGSGNTFTATYTMTATDAETTVPFTINFTNLAGNPGTQVSTTTNGSTVLFDKTVPAVATINRQSPLTQTTNASTLTFRATFSEKVNNVDYTDFTLSIVSGTVSGILNNQSVVAVGTNGTTYDVTINSVNGNGTLRLDLKGTGTNITDDAGNAIAGGFTGGQTYIVNQTAPSLTSVSILSGNSNSSLARVGDVITLSFTASEPINTPTVTIATHAVTATAGSGNSFTATYTMTSSDAETTVPFTINFTNLAGNPGTQVSSTTNGSTVLFDKTVPAVATINRQSPLTQTTNASTLTFRATFSEKVNNVDYTDFTLSIVSGTVSGILNNQSVVAVGTNGTTYDVTINSVNGNGTIRLDLKGTGTGITDDAGNAIAGGFTGGQTYVINQTNMLQGFATITDLNPVTVSATTGEKPQSKVWAYDGKHWAVLANSTGTYLWRLDGITWTNILKLSTRTTSKVDCKVVGNVVHILLYQGPSSQMVSVEYVQASQTYTLWSNRTSTVGLTLDTGVETAVIDIDGNGRMWLASAGVSDINVRWSDAPYNTWSSPVTVATGVTDDDICDVIYMPTAHKIGLMWSNQNTKRFGFKTHNDGADPSTWSADEVPASQSALNVGNGMADDHLNFAIASDGTLYCAVKTSYDLAGYPKIALLIRRPAGTWDNLYEVSQAGTRPIALLNESIGKIRIVYSSVEGGGDIVYKESLTSSISFSSQFTLIKGGLYNDPTSTKDNFTSEIVILASDATKAVGVLASDNQSLAARPAVSLVTASSIDSKPSEIELGKVLKAYPNPFLSRTTIQFVIPETGTYDVTLYDSRGAKIAVLKKGKALFGEISSIDVSGYKLAKGVYFISLQSNSYVTTLKLILQNR